MGSPIEFVDDDPPRPPAAVRSGPRPGTGTGSDTGSDTGSNPRTDNRSKAVPVLWLAAAILCVISTFQAVFTYRFDGFVIRSHGGYNAAGRSFDTQLAGDQGPRYALVLWVCALLFMFLAMLTLQRSRGDVQTRWMRWTPGVAVAAVSLFVGVLACIGLGLDSQYATYRALAETLRASGGRGVDLSIGGCLWYGLAALGCALAALVTSVGGWSMLVIGMKRRTPHR